MKKKLYFILLFWMLCFLGCISDKKGTESFEKFLVDKNLPQNDTIQMLSKYPELKLFVNEKVESTVRTAFIIQQSGYFDGFCSTRSFYFNDYKCRAEKDGDTIKIWLNNYNGYFGNGILVKVFKDRFLIRDIDPNTLKSEIKFTGAKPIIQKLVLNRDLFKKNDSISGYINYKTKIDSLVTKNFRGYFKTIVR